MINLFLNLDNMNDSMLYDYGINLLRSLSD